MPNASPPHLERAWEKTPGIFLRCMENTCYISAVIYRVSTPTDLAEVAGFLARERGRPEREE